MAERTLIVSSAGVATDKISVGGDGILIMTSDSDSFIGTLTVQFSTLDLGTWIDDAVITGEVVYKVKPANEIFMRVVCGDYTSGSIKVSIYREFIKDT